MKFFIRIFALCLFTVFCLSFYSLKHLSSEYNIKQFFPKKHALLEQERRVVAHFKLQEKSSLVMILETKNQTPWLSQNLITQLRDFASDIESQNSVKTLYSLGKIQGTFEVNQDLYVGDLFAQVPVKYWKKMIASHPIAKPNLLSKNNKQTLFVVELTDNTPEKMKNFQAYVDSLLKTKYKNISAEYAGVPLLQNDVAKLLKAELIRSVIFGVLIFIGVLMTIFGGWSGLALSVGNLVFVNIISLAMLVLFGIKLDVLLSTLPVLVSLMTISLTVHILLRVAKVREYASPNLKTKFLGIIENLRSHFLEYFLATLMPAIGFLMLTTSDIGIIHKYGQSVSTVIVLSWFLSQLFMIPALLFLPKVDLRSWSSQKAFWSLRLLKYGQPVMATTYGLLVFGIFGFFFLNWNTRLFDDLPKNSATRINTEKIDSTFGGTIPVSIVLFGSEKTWVDPQAMKKLDLLSKDLKKLNSVGSVISTADLLKKSSLKGSRLPATAAEASESLFLFSMAENDPTASYLNQLNHLTRLELRLKDAPFYSQQKDLEQAKYLIQKHFPGIRYNISGMGVSAHQLNSEMSKELIFSFWHAIVVIGFILIFVFRSYKWALVACLPNLVPPLALIAILAASRTPIKPSVAIIFSIAIGLAFSNTVYLLGKLKKVIKEKNLVDYLPVKSMLVSEMIPCLLATVLVASGFIVFTFSYFEMNKIFGVYMILSIFAGAFADLLFLPSFIKRYPNFLLKNQTMAPPKMITATTASFVLLLVFAQKSFSATLDVDSLLKKSKSLIASKDDVADVTMKIIEKDGSVKERSMQIKRKFGAKHMTLVRMKSPTDLKGTALLNVIEDGKENQWLYLPSTKQVRRIMGAQNKKAGVLGSELTPEDLDITTVKGSKATLLKEMKVNNQDFALIEIKSNSNTTGYSKALVLVSLKTSLPARLEYYDKQNKAVKRVDFENYVQVGGAYRAQSIKVRNLVNKRGTDLILSNIKSNSGLSEDEFSQRALSRE
ncbi:MAG: outer membrane lipoprotein-sorting protein [Pseudobdellovibrio sp.]|nr:outer membrane lipoprotein-sorting protein [Pseudobdellovibrio sp.]